MSLPLRAKNMDHKKAQMKRKENSSGHRIRSIGAPIARNLRKADLGSVIFGCKHSTFKECMFKQLFGLPSLHYSYVRNVGPGMPLFLFNYSDRKLHGIFEAQSEGQMNINKYAWTFDGDDMTQFPAQVKVRIRKQCQPLPEDQFRPIIGKNYFEQSLFWFELDKAQTHRMLALFMASTVPQSISRQDTPNLHTKTGHEGSRSLEKGSPSLSNSSIGQALIRQEPLPKQKDLTTSFPEKSWCSLFKHPPIANSIKEQETAPSSNLYDHESENRNTECPSKFDMDWESIYCSDGEDMLHEDQSHDRAAHNVGMQVHTSEESYEENHLVAPEAMITHSNETSVVSDDETATLLSENSSHQSNIEWGCSSAMDSHCEDSQDPSMQKPRLDLSKNNCCAHISAFADEEKENNGSDSLISLSADEAVELTSFTEEIISKMTLSDLRSFTVKLLHAMEKSKLSQLVQEQINHSLKQEQVQPKTETLKGNLRVPESASCLSTGLVDEEQFKKSLYSPLNFGHSILLAGGYDGSLFRPALDSYFPSVDHTISLKPMKNVRPYATSVQLNNELYVLGGGDGKAWHDTVESYDLRNDCWVYRPSLSKKKGSLVGVGLDNKIFAIGGGNGTDCFKDVEMLDLGFGKWISAPSMLQKRFASAAAEIKGLFYVVGGYDGKYYLNSMEGFDPRGRSWTALQSMHTRRGCHCVTVLNEKLYAIGGYDGQGMVSSVEVYDPRLGAWMMAEPLNKSRGYFGAATIGSSMYSIGGITESGEISASVECYSEGYGWQLIKSESVGKRSAFSAVAIAPEMAVQGTSRKSEK